ncbi:MAG: ABC transporter ATP-binding protein [Promethearchaeota archaeon]
MNEIEKESQNIKQKAISQTLKNPKSPRIIIDKVIKIYKRGKIEVVALRSLSCKFYAGEITVIMGPSGCGKTTLLNLIGGLDKPDSGRIIVDDVDITKLSDKEIERYRKEKIGYVFQFMNLIPELNAEENVGLSLMLANTPLKKRKQIVNSLLSLVGLQDRAHHKPDELSGGEQQRIAIAAALANNPEIILCDEPTGELDSKSKFSIMSLFHDIRNKYPEKLIIIVTHDMDLKRIADRLYFIRDGAISHKLSKEELMKNGNSEKEDEYEKSINFIDGHSSASAENMDNLIDKESLINELREIEYLIKSKIRKLEGKEI